MPHTFPVLSYCLLLANRKRHLPRWQLMGGMDHIIFHYLYA